MATTTNIDLYNETLASLGIGQESTEPEAPAVESPTIQPEDYTSAFTGTEFAAQPERESPEGPSYGDILEGAARKEITGFDLMYDYEGEGEVDMGFEPTEEFHEQLLEGIPSYYWPDISGYTSMEDGWAMRNRVLSHMEIDDNLDSGLGITTRIAAGVVDPVGILLSIGTGGALGAVSKVSKMTKLARALTIAGTTAVENMAVETALQQWRPGSDPTDILIAGVSGGILGGLAGSLQKVAPDSQEMAEAVMKEANRWQSGESVGAAKVVASDIPERFGEMNPDVSPTGKQATAGPRMDMRGYVGQSESPEIRDLGAKLSPETVGYVDGGEIVEQSASEIKEVFIRSQDTLYHKGTDQPFKDFKKAAGRKYDVSGKLRREFEKQTIAAVRDPNTYAAAPKHIQDAADATIKGFSKTWDDAVEAGLPGFSKEAKRTNYIPRVFQPDAFKDLAAKVGHDEIKRMLMGATESAIKKAGKTVSEEDLTELVNKYHDILFKKSTSLGSAARMNISETLDEELVEGLERLGFTKQRYPIDETFEARLMDLQGNDIKFNVADMYSQDLTTIQRVYNLKVGSQLALHKKGLGSREEFALSIQKASERATAMGKTIDAKETDALMSMYDSVAGEFDVKAGDKALRRFSDYNFMRLLGQAGFASVGELGNVIGTYGIKTFIKAVPELARSFKRAPTGELASKMANELEDLTGLGTDVLRLAPSNRYDQYGSYVENVASRLGRGYDAAASRGKSFVAMASGLAPVNQALHRISMVAGARHFMNAASDLKYRAKWSKRLAADGLDGPILDRIRDQISKHGSEKQLNVHNWDDYAALESFKTALFRSARRAVQEGDVGDMPRWVSENTWAKALLQFRNFTIIAFHKQLGYAVNQRDPRVMTSLMLSMGLAYTAHTIRTSLNGIGRDDYEDYMKSRGVGSDPETIAKGMAIAFERSSIGSVPALLIDSVTSPFMDSKTIFTGARTTGLTPGVLNMGSAPTLDLLQNIEGLYAGLGNKDAGKSAESAVRLLPFQNTMGLAQFVNILNSANK